MAATASFRFATDQVVGLDVVGDVEVDGRMCVLQRDLGVTHMRISYDTDGTLDAILNYDDAGNLLFVANYSANNTCVDLTGEPTSLEPFHLPCGTGGRGASRLVCTYDEMGTVTSVRTYAYSRNTPV